MLIFQELPLIEPLTAQIIIAFIFGTAFVVALLVLAIAFPKPTPFQYLVFKITLSLAAAGVAAMIPGFVNVRMDTNIGLAITAGGALAIFVIVFFFNPAQLAIQASEKSPTWEQVAAVCYRTEQNSIEFLLVRTTGGRWTFPKGNVDSGEEKWFAAQREAFEEAGVSGDIEHEPLTKYLHEKKEWKDKGIEVNVQAFLLHVKKTQPPEEEHRNPTWFSETQAGEALAEDRKFKYGEEFRRVLRGAVKRINDLPN
jgi:8-oxo-dGTP pyrophosphatase MutT (NUDIX family)